MSSGFKKIRTFLSDFFAIKTTHKKMNRDETIVVSKTLSTANECYNALKDNLLMIDITKHKVIQLESCVSSEGKTTLACNLAVSFSFNDKKVLVVDLDFRKPRVNRTFKMPNEDGIVDYMYGKMPFERLIKHTEYENVDIITRGAKIYNPSFLLTSDRFKELMERLRGMYDLILLDSPPMLQISDYTHISKVADGVLFVVCYRQTRRAEIVEATELFEKAGINVIGAVMTRVDKKDPYSYYYGNYKKYGYRYGAYYGGYYATYGDKPNGKGENN